VECYIKEVSQDVGKRNIFAVMQQMPHVRVVVKPKGRDDWEEFRKT
jgi:hypothetical protein